MKIIFVALAAATLASPALAQANHNMGSMGPMDHMAMPAGAQGTGIVKKLDLSSGSITLQHGPISALGWPAMTMTFKAKPAVLQGLKIGEKVDFTVKPGAPPEVIAVMLAK
jgi:Cu(I)/Ag(I) efflux system protein CusF